ncbi:MAG: hypothetical protein JL56_17165 [Desulfotomaculum sp. BICA1-6]|nr:MAG: hypothetical protein JL56_17165 [Desulfotomaculum sp. BICA1-6]
MLLSDKRGFSLVEMMVALAILGIVLALGFQFYAFGANSFNAGQSQSNVQQNTRLAASIISKEVRFVDSLEIINVNESYTFSPEKRYIYVKDDSFKIRKNGVEESILESISNNIIFSLEFIRDKKGDRVLYFEVSADNSGRISTVDSEVQILNIEDVGIKPMEPENSAFSGNAICYTITDAASVAAAITSFDDPAQNATKLDLPTVPSGYTIAINTSDKTDVIDTDGTVAPPTVATTVTLVFTVTKTSDGTTADTVELEVLVPAYIDFISFDGVGINIAAGIIDNTTFEMEYNLDGGSDGSSGSWFSASEGNTPVTFVPGHVWVRETEYPSNMHWVQPRIDSPAEPPDVYLSHDNKQDATFMKFSKNGTQVNADDGYEYKVNSADWADIMNDTVVDSSNQNTIIVRVKATQTKLASQETANLD